MHIDHDHLGGPVQDNCHAHTHTHADGTTHTHVHHHADSAQEDHNHTHDQQGSCSHDCANCATAHTPTPMEELTALMRYMAGHNAAHAKELAELAKQLDEAGSHTAYEQVMAAVSDFEKGNLRLSAVLASLDA